MSARWISGSSEASGRVVAALTGVLASLSQPEQMQRLRRVALLLLSVWAVLGLTRLIWAFVPVNSATAGPPPQVINPISVNQRSTSAEPVDIGRIRSWHLFGKAGATEKPVAQEVAVEADTSRDGIEKGARETRLNLVLRGVVASTEDGLGHAIIENKSKQEVYAVGDKLPVSGKVTLAKVMPRQVVLDNGGTYELLMLFEDSELGRKQAAARPKPVAKPQPASSDQQIDKREDAEITAMAQSYRERLYKNPQSLASVVSVSAVREGGQLLGYRVRPGRDKEQFDQLGFKPGDLVTSVNGISLDDPANTMTLYNAMRSAGEVVFDLERDSQALSISVSLGDQ